MSTCQVRIWRPHAWKSTPCDRPAKGEWKDTPMCGIHLAAERRRVENGEKRRRRSEQSANNYGDAKARCEALAEFGIEAMPQYSDVSSRYTGSIVVINPSKLLDLLKGAS